MAGTGFQPSTFPKGGVSGKKKYIRKKKSEQIYIADQSHDAERISVTPRIVEQIRSLLRSDGLDEIRDIFSKLHYADQALLFESISTEYHERLILAIQGIIESLLLFELLSPIRIKITKVLGFEKIGSLLEHLSPEDVIDFLSSFPRVDRIALLKCTNLEKRKLVRAIINRPENSAASIGSCAFIVVNQSWSVEKTISKIKEFELVEGDRLYDVFVSSPQRKIVGIVDLVSLLKSNPSRTIQSIMKTNFVTMNETNSTRDVVHAFNKYGLNTVPVLSEDGIVTSTISIDTVRYIADEQGEEDILKMSGVLSDLDESIVDTAKIRFVWLFVNLITTALCSWIISFFESAIHQITALAVLMPITVSMGSNAGTQTVTVIIRALATRHLNRGSFRMYFSKEMIISLFNSVVFAAICVFGVNHLYRDIALALVFGVSIAITIFSSVLAGVITPVAMKFLGTDPAITSVVFLTAVIDVVSFLSFLGLAQMLLM